MLVGVCPKASESAQAVTRFHGLGVSQTTDIVSPGPGGCESEIRVPARPGLVQACSWFTAQPSRFSSHGGRGRKLSGTPFLSTLIPPPGGLATWSPPRRLMRSTGVSARPARALILQTTAGSTPQGQCNPPGPAIRAAANIDWSGKGLALCSCSPWEERTKPTLRKSAPRGKVRTEAEREVARYLPEGDTLE